MPTAGAEGVKLLPVATWLVRAASLYHVIVPPVLVAVNGLMGAPLQ